MLTVTRTSLRWYFGSCSQTQCAGWWRRWSRSGWSRWWRLWWSRFWWSRWWSVYFIFIEKPPGGRPTIPGARRPRPELIRIQDSGFEFVWFNQDCDQDWEDLIWVYLIWPGLWWWWFKTFIRQTFPPMNGKWTSLMPISIPDSWFSSPNLQKTMVARPQEASCRHPKGPSGAL